MGKEICRQRPARGNILAYSRRNCEGIRAAPCQAFSHLQHSAAGNHASILYTALILLHYLLLQHIA